MKKQMMITAASFVAMSAFDNEGGNWKTDENGALVLQDGNPVYVQKDGTEQVVENGTIARLNKEAKTNRERAETAETKLKTFEGIDPEKAKEAFTALEKVGQKQLIEAGEVDRVKAEIEKQFQETITNVTGERDKYAGQLDDLRLDMAFQNSEFVKNNVAVPTEMFRAVFGKNAKIEDGKPVLTGADGNRLMSKKSAGAYAEFDEGLEILVNGYQHKDSILNPPDANGSGSGGGGGGRGVNGARMSTADFDKLAPGQQAEAAAKAGRGELTIYD